MTDTTGVIIIAETVSLTIARELAWVLGLLCAFGALTCALTVREWLEVGWHTVTTRRSSRV